MDTGFLGEFLRKSIMTSDSKEMPQVHIIAEWIKRLFDVILR